MMTLSKKLPVRRVTSCFGGRPFLDVAQSIAGARQWCWVIAASTLLALPPLASAATLLSADFNVDSSGFVYHDDIFLATQQPLYASGSRVANAGYNGSGGLQVVVGGIDATSVTGISGGWRYTLNLPTASNGVSLSFRYKLSLCSRYEYEEFGRVLVSVDGVLQSRGSKPYIDHLGGSGNDSRLFEPTTEWQQQMIHLGNLAAGSHVLQIGAYNNKKSQPDEIATLWIDDVVIVDGAAAPGISDAQILVNRLDLARFKSNIQAVAGFGDRCRVWGCSAEDSQAFLSAQSWVAQQLTSMGYTPQYHTGTFDDRPYSNLHVTKRGTLRPDQMYIVSAHLDGRGNGGAADDDGSGVSLVLEVARALATADVRPDQSIRFIFWDREEDGRVGSLRYAAERQALQGIQQPAGSGLYPEPTWLGILQHDMLLFDHGAGIPGSVQSEFADLDVEWRGGSVREVESRALAMAWRYHNGNYSVRYPATAYDFSTATDDRSFHDVAPSISIRENRRSINSDWNNPHWHDETDLYATYSAADFELGFNAVQATLGTVIALSNTRIVRPVANPQSPVTPEDQPIAIVLTGSDPNNAPLNFTVLNHPAHGSLSGTAPHLSYQPTANFHGIDSLRFKVDNGLNESPPATVSITVTPVPDAPLALAQSVLASSDTPKPITLTGLDVDNDPLSFAIAQLPMHGGILGLPPHVTYVPDTGYIGTDSFTFTANDGGLTSPAATVSITVNLFGDGFESIP
jgi:hypothetical protein